MCNNRVLRFVFGIFTPDKRIGQLLFFVFVSENCNTQFVFWVYIPENCNPGSLPGKAFFLKFIRFQQKNKSKPVKQNSVGPKRKSGKVCTWGERFPFAACPEQTASCSKKLRVHSKIFPACLNQIPGAYLNYSVHPDKSGK